MMDARIQALMTLRHQLDQPGVAHRLQAMLEQLNTVAIRSSAGHLLRKCDRQSFGAELPDVFKPLKIAIVSNFTTVALENLLRVELFRAGILPEFYIADFDQFHFELMSPESGLRRHEPDVVICLLDAQVITSRLGGDWSIDKVEAVLEEASKELLRLFVDYTSGSAALLVLNTLPLPRGFAAQVIDHRSKARLSAVWRQFNSELLGLSSAHANIFVIDPDLMLQESRVRLSDPRLSAYAGMHMDDSLLAQMACEYRKVVQSRVGRSLKCLVLDCDNTLWGGIVGDEGVEGIQLGGSAEGDQFVAFQRIVKNLSRQGVILALNSKNDQRNIDDVLAHHAECVLQSSDFAAQKVNWHPKNDNLRQIAADLNIDTSHMVFVDDSAFETELVRETMPEVRVIRLPEDVLEYPDALLRDGWFDILELTEADRSRNADYRQSTQRRKLQASTGSYTEYLGKLGVTVQLSRAVEGDIPRLAQLSQKTNQFNLTTIRLTPAQLRHLIADPDWQVHAIRSGDRFGDNGLIGAVLTEKKGDILIVRNFLLSCRVFSRGIAERVLYELRRIAAGAGWAVVCGQYSPSAKNTRFASFYRQNGFEPAPPDADGTQNFIARWAEAPCPADWIHFTSFREEISYV